MDIGPWGAVGGRVPGGAGEGDAAQQAGGGEPADLLLGCGGVVGLDDAAPPVDGERHPERGRRLELLGEALEALLAGTGTVGGVTVLDHQPDAATLGGDGELLEGAAEGADVRGAGGGGVDEHAGDRRAAQVVVDPLDRGADLLVEAERGAPEVLPRARETLAGVPGLTLHGGGDRRDDARGEAEAEHVQQALDQRAVLGAEVVVGDLEAVRPAPPQARVQLGLLRGIRGQHRVGAHQQGRRRGLGHGFPLAADLSPRAAAGPHGRAHRGILADPPGRGGRGPGSAQGRGELLLGELPIGHDEPDRRRIRIPGVRGAVAQREPHLPRYRGGGRVVLEEVGDDGQLGAPLPGGIHGRVGDLRGEVGEAAAGQVGPGAGVGVDPVEVLEIARRGRVAGEARGGRGHGAMVAGPCDTGAEWTP